MNAKLAWAHLRRISLRAFRVALINLNDSERYAETSSVTKLFYVADELNVKSIVLDMDLVELNVTAAGEISTVTIAYELDVNRGE